MWLYVLLGLAALIVLILMAAMFRNPDLHVSRTVTMNCTPERAFEQVNNLRNMIAWNPFLKLDPEAKVSYEVSESGVGAICTWDGNSNVGAGKQTIIAIEPARSVQMSLEFYRPFPGTNAVEFQFAPRGSQTDVTWNMKGKLAFMPRLVGLFCSMEKMCGDNFVKGLNDLKRKVEA